MVTADRVLTSSWPLSHISLSKILSTWGSGYFAWGIVCGLRSWHSVQYWAGVFMIWCQPITVYHHSLLKCLPSSLLTISIVGLPHYLWLTGLQWVKPVYTSTDCTVVHTSWSHSHLNVHFTHMCVWDQTLVQLHTIAIVSNSQWSSTNSLLYSIHICLPFLHRFSIIMYYNLVIYSMKWNSFMNVTFYLFVYCSSWMDKGTN